MGLISSPAEQIARVISEAGGAQLARTLEGLRRALEVEQNPEKSTSEGGDQPSA